jgi:hypothetical protein
VYQVEATLTLPNMVIEIPILYIDLPSMVPKPSFSLQIVALPIYTLINHLFPQPSLSCSTLLLVLEINNNSNKEE